MKQLVVNFKCLKCGNCCVNLINYSPHLTTGLYLLPDEIGLFSTKYIAPCIGTDLHLLDNTPQVVRVFQLNIAICPKLTSKNECLIYKERPRVCHSYPIQISMSRDQCKIEPRFSTNCHFMKQYYGENKQQKIAFSGEKEETTYHQIEHYFQSVFDNYQGDIRFYDLNTQSWV